MDSYKEIPEIDRSRRQSRHCVRIGGPKWRIFTIPTRIPTLRLDWQLKKAIFANPDTKTDMVSALCVRRTALHLRFIFVPFALHLRFLFLGFARDTR